MSTKSQTRKVFTIDSFVRFRAPQILCDATTAERKNRALGV